MATIPDLPHLYQTLVSGGFGTDDQMLGRAIADALLLVGAVTTGNLTPAALPNIGKHYGAAEARKAVAIAEAIKEKGLLFGTIPSDQGVVGRAKEILETPKTFYVDKNKGDDIANDGLTPDTPLQTLSWAVNYIRSNYDLNGFTATVLIAPGYYGPLDLRNLMLNGKLVLVGAETDPSKARIERIDAENIINDLVLDKLTVQTGINLENCHTVKLSRLHFSRVAAVQSRVKVKEYCHILPGAPEVYMIASGSTLDACDTIHFIKEELNLNRFIVVKDQSGAKFNHADFDFKERITGRTFDIEGSSYITTGSNDTMFLPGSIPGKIAANCSYDDIVGNAGTAIKVDNSSNQLQSTDLQGSLGEIDKRLRKLEAQKNVSSFNDRSGDVYPRVEDYDAEMITYRDYFLQEVLDQLVAGVDRLVRLPKVQSFNGRKGDIQPAKGDYTSDQILADGVSVATRLGSLRNDILSLEDAISVLHNRPNPVLDTDGLVQLREAIATLQHAVLNLEQRPFSTKIDPSSLTASEISCEVPNGFLPGSVQSTLNQLVSMVSQIALGLDKVATEAEATIDEVETLKEKAGNIQNQQTLNSKAIDSQQTHIDNLWEKDKYHQRRGTSHVDSASTYYVGKDQEFKYLQDVIDIIHTRLSVNRVLTIQLGADYDPSQEVVLVRGQYRGIGQVVITGELPEIQFDGSFGYLIKDSLCTYGITASGGSQLDIEDTAFSPIKDGYNLLADQKSTIGLSGKSLLTAGSGLQFAVSEYQSSIVFAPESKLIVDSGNEYKLALMQAQFQGILDVRQAAIQSTHRDPVILKGQSLLIGADALPTMTDIELDDTCSVIK